MGIPGIALMLLAICGAGAAIGSVLRGEKSTTARGVGFGWSYLWGVALVGLLLHLPLAIDGRMTHVTFALVAASCLAASIGYLHHRWRQRQQSPETTGRIDGWLLDLPRIGQFFAGIVIVLALIHSAISPLITYDARAIYWLKARILYETGDLHSEDFCDVDRVHFNATYPLLMPLVEAQAIWAAGNDDGVGLKLIVALFGLALVSIIADELRRYETRSRAAWWAVYLLMVPMIFGVHEGAGLSGSVDLPLAALATGAVLQIARWLESRNWRPLLGGALLLAAAVLTKPEGILWFFACGFALALAWLFRRLPMHPAQWRAAALAAGVVVAAALLHAASHRHMPQSPYYRSYGATLTWDWLRQLGDRPLTVAQHALQELTQRKWWAFTWPCIIGSLLLLRRQRSRHTSCAVADQLNNDTLLDAADGTRSVSATDAIWYIRTALVLLIAAYLFTFVITPYHVVFQLRTAFTRLSLHFFPLCLLVMAEQMAASGWTRQMAKLLTFDDVPDADRVTPATDAPEPLLRRAA